MPRAALRSPLALGTCLLFVACGQPTGDPTPDGGGGPTFTPGGCGLSGYDLLPTSEVGEAVSFEELTSQRRSADTIDGLLSLVGVTEFSPVPYGAQVFRMRYTTQDRGRKVEATGLVALPWLEVDRHETRPVVLFLHGTSGFTGACAPSAPGNVEDNALYLSLLASQGYVTVAPDYIGLDADVPEGEIPPVRHAYLGVEQTAIGSWDMVRAAETIFGVQADTFAVPGRDVVLWGGSQGGHAVFSAERLWPYYASEYDVRAAVALVPPTDLAGLASYALSSPNPATVAMAAAATSLDRWYRDGADVSELLTDEDPTYLATRVPEFMDTACDPGSSFDGITSVDDVYQPAVIENGLAGDWDAVAPYGCFLQENSFADNPIPRLSDTPFFFVLGENDDLVYTPVEREDFDRLCTEGYAMDYLECAGAGHTQGALWSLPEQVRWVEARLSGDAIPAEELCVRQAAVHCSAEQ